MFSPTSTPIPTLCRTPSSDALERCSSAFAATKVQAGSDLEARALTTVRDHAVQRHVDTFVSGPNMSERAAKAHRLLLKNVQADAPPRQLSRTVIDCVERRIQTTDPYYFDLKKITTNQMGKDFEKNIIAVIKNHIRLNLALINPVEIETLAADMAIDALFDKLPLDLMRLLNLRSEFSDQEVLTIIHAPNQEVLAESTRRLMNDFASDKIDLTPKTRALLDSISQGTFCPKPNLEHDRFLQACGGTELIKPMAESIMPALLGDTHVDCKKLEAGARQMFWPLYLEYYKDIDVAAYEAYAAVTNFADVRLKMANQFVKSVNSWGKAIDSMAQREINKVFFRVRIKPNDRQ